ncbi:MAG: hypothetical protein C0520_03645 [Sphingopyxis sp.]|nr:hypothetical protein [Sphingopyxis sp.]
MDAIMISLVAVALANADGRAGAFFARLLAARSDAPTVIAAAAGAFLSNAVVAAALGALANRTIGPGIAALLVALALLSAALGLLWPRPRGGDDAIVPGASGAALAARLAIAQFGDRSHFLIGALAATSGAGLWAAAGGTIGWTIALVPFLAFGPALAERRGLQWLRWGAALALAVWGLRVAVGAFGLIG